MEGAFEMRGCVVWLVHDTTQDDIARRPVLWGAVRDSTAWRLHVDVQHGSDRSIYGDAGQRAGPIGCVV